MNIQQRKIQLIDKIIHLNKEYLIEKLESIISSDKNSTEKLSDAEIKLIEKAREEFDNNRVSTNEDVKNRIKQKFNFS